jgi:hypothetical protein
VLSGFPERIWWVLCHCLKSCPGSLSGTAKLLVEEPFLPKPFRGFFLFCKCSHLVVITLFTLSLLLEHQSGTWEMTKIWTNSMCSCLVVPVLYVEAILLVLIC